QTRRKSVPTDESQPGTGLFCLASGLVPGKYHEACLIAIRHVLIFFKRPNESKRLETMPGNPLLEWDVRLGKLTSQKLNGMNRIDSRQAVNLAAAREARGD